MSEFNRVTALVTGGAGFIGSNLALELLRRAVSAVHIVDNLLSAEPANVPNDPRVRFIEGSISDDSILRLLQDDYDYVFHLATYHGNQSSIHDPIADHDNNLITTLKLLEHVKDFRRLRKLVYSGAGCAVAEKTLDRAGPTDEDAPISLHMDSPYSISKVVGEFYTVYYHARHKVPAVRARFQNVYGPRETLGAGKWRGTPATVWRNVTPTFIYKAITGQPIPLENEGTATRDFIFVEDIVEGLLLCALRGVPGEVYNLASGLETSIRDLAMQILELTGSPSPIELRPKRDWDSSGKRFGSTEKAERELGFRTRVRLPEGLQSTIEWTWQNLPMIEAAMQKHAVHMPDLAGVSSSTR